MANVIICRGYWSLQNRILVTTEQFFPSKSSSNNYVRNWFMYLIIQMFVDCIQMQMFKICIQCHECNSNAQLSKVHLLTNLIHNVNSFRINSQFVKMLLIIV